MEGKTHNIYEAICGVMADIGAVGKNKKNQQQGFMFRGIDDVMNALAPALVKNKVFIVPEVTHEERTERVTPKGGVLFYTRLHVNYHFYTTDGSSVTASVIGEAMDSGDKATNKAMSIAYKYAAFQVFNIPTEEMQDPDAEVHSVGAVEYIDEIKIRALKKTMEDKGVVDQQIFDRYKVSSFEELTMDNFMSAVRSLGKMPDVEKKEELDLGLQ